MSAGGAGAGTGNRGLNDVETDFIEFLSQREGYDPVATTEMYLELRSRFGFDTRSYRDLCTNFLDLHAVLYNKDDERHLVRLYKRAELLSVLRFISYSFTLDSPPPHSLERHIKRLFRKEEYTVDLSKTKREGLAEQAVFMVEQAGESPVVVDYGCGLAYQSYELVRRFPGATIYLVDIDTLNLRLAEYRLKKLDVKVGVITVTEDDLYPVLPQHDICIATEVIEHVKEPLTLYGNIVGSMNSGGILCGDFSDHEPDRFHVSHILGDVRERLKADFTAVGKDIYKKL